MEEKKTICEVCSFFGIKRVVSSFLCFQSSLFVTFNFIKSWTDACMCVCVCTGYRDGQKGKHLPEAATQAPGHYCFQTHDDLHRRSLSVFLSPNLSFPPSVSLTAFWVTGSPSRLAHALFSVHPASILATKAFRQSRLKINESLCQCNTSRCAFRPNKLYLFPLQ